MVSEGRKLQHQVSTPQPPRKINAQKFAESRGPELKALQSIISIRLDNNFRSRRNKRRRTTAFDDQVARKGNKRSRTKNNPKVSDLGSKNDQSKKTSRRIRRSRELRQNPNSGFCLSGDGTKRLRTHVWHAKRFTMTKLWGFYLPLGFLGRGKGSRALLKKLKERVLVHDASYHNAVQLEGPEDSLVSILRKVLMPSPSEHIQSTPQSILSGLTYGNAMLYQVGFSHCIAPVTYMWRPLCQKDIVNVTTETIIDETPKSNTELDQVKENEMSMCGNHCESRQLWLWIHASAFEEGFTALQCACQKEMDERNSYVICHSLEGELGKLEIVGSGAFQLLQKVLHPVSSTSKDDWQVRKCTVLAKDTDSEYNRSSMLKEMDHISCAILSLNVEDPRQLPSTLIQRSILTQAPDNLAEAEVVEPAAVSFLPFWSRLEQISSSHVQNDLWDPDKRLIPPVEENIICMEKHQQHMELFCVDEANLQKPNNSIQVQCSRSCPILLLKNNSKSGLVGLSVVLPLSWVRAFWISLVCNGAQAIGLREKHWISCDMGLPFYPSDFPDCSAYSHFMSTIDSATSQKTELRPLSKRPSRVPIPPPWHSIRTSLHEEFSAGGTPLPFTKDNTANADSLSNDGGSFYLSSDGENYNLFDGIVARTGRMLSNFLDEVQASPALLFPGGLDEEISNNQAVKDNMKFGLDKNEAFLNSYDRKLCFVRVHLCACKEGNFEEGGVICAPRPSDLSSWTSSSEQNESGLRISQSAADSYFEIQSPSRWEIQIPQDPIGREFHRWPIGFVTTGFVRGSKKLMAEGLCEAVLLSHLREKQWKDVPSKLRRKDIYVFVRNLRSTAYRLALATIVLEHQEDDLEFM